MSSERLPWFPCYPSKLLGALAAMKPYEGYVYWIVCLRIYEVGGPCPDSLDALARRTGYSKRVVIEALDLLFQSGKLRRELSGITNPFASEVLAETRLHREGLSAAGQKGAERRWKKSNTNQQSGDAHPNAEALAKNAHRQEQESLFPNGNRARDAAPDVLDERTRLWREGLATLERITGKTADGCRKLIGKWLKQTDDDCVKVRRTIEDADRNRIGEPVSWIEGAIGTRARIDLSRKKAGSSHLELKRYNQQYEQEEGDGTDEGGGDGRRSLPAPRGG
jgi:hypothetical protein